MSFGWHLVRKRNGRVIHVPCPRLMLMHWRLLPILQRRVRLAPCVHGYRVGHNTYSALLPHAGRSYLLHLDLRRFFHSCTREKVVSGLLMSTMPDLGIRLIESYCFVDNRLPLGFPTSPYLSNVAMRFVDAHLSRLGTYTRYSDQLLISADVPPDKRLAREVIRSHGFRLNEKKCFMHNLYAKPLTLLGHTLKDGLILPTK